MTKDGGNRASEARNYEISLADLPLSCPLPKQRVWDAHPRVYLTLDKAGKAVCPYCSAKYTLSNKV